MENDKIQHLIVKSAPHPIEPSQDFDLRFWKKVHERESEPGFIRGFQELVYWIPTPNFAQVAAVILMALLIGGGTGVVSAMNAPSVSLSGFKEIKGVPMPSISGTYLKTIQARDSR